MQITINFDDVVKLGKNMEKRSERLKDAIEVILKKSLFVVERHAKYFSPVKTGRMRASITEGMFFGKTFASVGPTVFYAKFVHRRIPFMYAAATESKSEIEDIVKDEVKKAIK